jgi:sugar lactone lactonase YvrE
MMRRLRIPLAYCAALGLAAGLVVTASAASAHSVVKSSAHARHAFPTEIALPDGWQPEGIAINGAPFAYFGSLVDGDIYRANLVTGTGSVISQGPGTPSVGLKLDHRGRLFVAGGTGGDGRVVSVATGDILASWSFAPGGFINDVVLTKDAAWFTESTTANLYKVPLSRNGALPPPTGFVTLPLTGDFQVVPGFNANGITQTPDGRGLIIDQTATGLLFRVDPQTGNTTQIDLGGALLPNADGMLLSGRTLFVVQNANNQVAVVHLNRAGTAGTVVQTLTDPRFDVPTTVAEFGNRLYLPNARFSTPPTPTTTYTAVAIRKP